MCMKYIGGEEGHDDDDEEYGNYDDDESQPPRSLQILRSESVTSWIGSLLGPSRGTLGAMLLASEALMMLSWGPLELLGRSWGPLGSVGGPLGAILEASWALLVLSWGPLCALLGPS